MFGFGKKKLNVAAPFKGDNIDITAVPDTVFAEKMMGDGFATMPEDKADTVFAPCDATITVMAETAHAVGLSAQGTEILIHVGLDTAALEGKGFTALVKEGSTVKKGTPLIRFDRAFLQENGKNLVTMTVVTNMDSVTIKKKNLNNAEAVLEIEY